MPHLDQSDEEVAALIQHLKQAIDSDRYALSPPLVPLKAVLAKLRAPVDRQTPAAAQVLRAAASNSCQKALSGPVEAKFGPGSIPRAGSAYDSLPGKLLPPQAVIGE